MGTLPVPKNKVGTIINALNEMLESGLTNEIALAGFKREIKVLKQSDDLGGAFIVQGMIACMEEDFDTMHSAHKNAMRYESNSLRSIANYAISLKNAKLTEEAYVYSLKAFELAPTDLYLLSMVIEELYDLVDKKTKYKDDFKKYTALWKKMTGDHHILYDDPAETANMIEACDALADQHPDLVTDIDPATWDLALRLTEGVELDK